MKKLFLKLLLLIPLLGIIIFINLKVNPGILYLPWQIGEQSEKKFSAKDDYEQAVVRYLLSGKNVTNLENWSERVLHKTHIENLSSSKDILVFGSSRSESIHADFVNSNSFLNCGVSGATLEDVLAIYNIYRLKGFTPKVVIFGVDPWIFNKYNKQTRFGALEYSYDQMLDVLGKKSIRIKYRISELFLPEFIEVMSPAFFQNTWNKLWRKISKIDDKKKLQINVDNKNELKAEEYDFYPTTQRYNDKVTLLTDGSISYDRKSREQSLENLNASIKTFLNSRDIYGLESFFEIDPRHKKEFEAFVSYLQENHVKVIFYLPAYHPFIYKTLGQSTKYKIIKDVEWYLRSFAQRRNIKVVGSYDPIGMSLQESDFLDAMHLKDEALERIFKNVKLN